MKSAKELHHSLKLLEDELLRKALSFAEHAVSAKRRHIGYECITAQMVSEEQDLRFEFRRSHSSPITFAELRLKVHNPILMVEFREKRCPDFVESLDWDYFDTLSKIIILKGLERAQSEMPRDFVI